MKKFGILFLLILMFSICWGAELINTSFEDSDGWDYHASGNWTEDANDGTWEGHGVAATEIASLRRTGIRFIYFNDLGDWFELPAMDNPGVLTFWARLSAADTGTVNRLKIQRFADPDWIDIDEITQTSATYEQFIVNINFAGTGVRLRFYRSADHQAHIIDDLVLTDDTPLPVTLSTFFGTYNEQPNLYWVTQSETDNLGFNLYRSENENGFEADEYLLLNNELIPGMGTTFIPTNYSFTDEFMALEGHTYYYWLQSVSTTNEVELFGPITIEIPYEEVITVLSEFTAVYESTNPVLNWSTASETDNLGYFVQRSEDPNGYVLADCTQLNSEIITGMGTTSYETNYTFIDENFVVEGHTYYYWLESVNPVGDVNVFGPASLEIPDQGGIPNAGFETSLNPNYPNPFNPETTIAFTIKENETGILSIYNLLGQQVLKENFQAGNHQYHWNAEGLASGIYFYKLSSPTANITKKMLLMK